MGLIEAVGKFLKPKPTATVDLNKLKERLGTNQSRLDAISADPEEAGRRREVEGVISGLTEQIIDHPDFKKEARDWMGDGTNGNHPGIPKTGINR